MTAYEYKVVPAPARGRKARGVKGADGRFANALEYVMNEMAQEGWEFQRTETLPSEERAGLTATTTTYRNIMVFRRPRGDVAAAFHPRVLDTAAPVRLPPPTPIPAPAPAPVQENLPPPPADDDPFLMGEDATQQDGDNVRALPVALLARAKAHPPREQDKADDVAAE